MSTSDDLLDMVLGLSSAKVTADDAQNAPLPTSSSAAADTVDTVGVGETVRECAQCRTREPPLQVCSCCKQVFYCSRQHQRLDWKTHKLTCIDANTKNRHSSSASAGAPSHAEETKMVNSDSQLGDLGIPRDLLARSFPTSLQFDEDYEFRTFDETYAKPLQAVTLQTFQLLRQHGYVVGAQPERHLV